MNSVNDNPLVSVIMPAYNAEQYIGEAIKSVLNQTYDNLELIVIEDCSRDNTLQEIEKIKDARLKLYKNSQNFGIAAATNRGLEVCKGRYVALLDDDDIAMPERLSLQVEFLEEHRDIDILGGRSIVIDKVGNVIDYDTAPRNNPKFIKAMLLFNYMDFKNGTVMIRREFITKNGLRYENECYGMQDFKFYIESSKLGKISSIDKFLLKYRIHDKNETVKRMKEFQRERAEKYAEFQKVSLSKSGYDLEEHHMNIIHKALAECNGQCESFEELKLLFQAFEELLKQAGNMNAEYYEELNILCKKKFTEKLVKLDIWEVLGEWMYKGCENI